nr:hypothetical protein CFP56_48795 [Quercus suber]
MKCFRPSRFARYSSARCSLASENRGVFHEFHRLPSFPLATNAKSSSGLDLTSPFTNPPLLDRAYESRGCRKIRWDVWGPPDSRAGRRGAEPWDRDSVLHFKLTQVEILHPTSVCGN